MKHFLSSFLSFPSAWKSGENPSFHSWKKGVISFWWIKKPALNCGWNNLSFGFVLAPWELLESPGMCQGEAAAPGNSAHPRDVGSPGGSNPRDLHPIPSQDPHNTSLILKNPGNSSCGRRKKPKQPPQTLEEAELNIPFKIS